MTRSDAGVSFQDFLEFSGACFKRHLGDDFLPISESHVFHLGDDEKVQDAMDDIWEDLKGEMAEIVPLPFDDTTCISRVPYPDGRTGWVLDRILEMPMLPGDREKFLKSVSGMDAATLKSLEARGLPKRVYTILRIEEGIDQVACWATWYMGTTDTGFILSSSPVLHTHELVYAHGDSPEARSFVMWAMLESRPILRQAAMISHPMNYIVKVTPALTPKEDRKVKAGALRPLRKAPHFIVVDHEVLTTMNPSGPQGTHASPVPHHRRGHWKRLAERCRKALFMGKSKVWVRPTYVGERVFSDEKHLYEVMLDFNRKPEPVTA